MCWRALAARRAVPGSGSYCGGLRFATTSRSGLAWGRRRTTHYAPLRPLRSNRYGESVTKRFAPVPRPSRFAATEIAAAGYRPPRRESGGIPPVACRQCWRQIRVRVGHDAQSDDAPAMSGFALGAKRFIHYSSRLFERSGLRARSELRDASAKPLIAGLPAKPDASSRGMAHPHADLLARCRRAEHTQRGTKASTGSARTVGGSARTVGRSARAARRNSHSFTIA